MCHMLEASSRNTPIFVKPPKTTNDDEPLSATEFQSLVGVLKYLTFTRPDIQYTVNQVCQHFQSPRKIYLLAIKRILCYLHGTMDYGLRLLAQSFSTLIGCSNADWAGSPITRRSTLGYCIYLGANCISWLSKK